MFFEVKVRKNGKEVWVDARKFFDYMIKEYSKVNYQGKSVDPYPDRVNAFYDNIPKNVKEAWKKAYPNVDINRESEKCRAWLLSNTNKAKKDFRRFTNNWLSRAMENGGIIPVNVDNKIEKQIKKHQDYMREAEEASATDEERKAIIKEITENLKWKKKNT